MTILSCSLHDDTIDYVVLENFTQNPFINAMQILINFFSKLFTLIYNGEPNFNFCEKFQRVFGIAYYIFCYS